MAAVSAPVSALWGMGVRVPPTLMAGGKPALMKMSDALRFFGLFTHTVEQGVKMRADFGRGGDVRCLVFL